MGAQVALDQVMDVFESPGSLVKIMLHISDRASHRHLSLPLLSHNDDGSRTSSPGSRSAMDDGDDSPASNSYPVAWGSKLNLWSVLQRSGGGCLISASPGKDDCGSTPNSAHSSSASTVAPSSTRSTPELRSERAADAGSKRKEDSDASRKLNVLEGTFTMANYLLNCGTFGVPFVFLLSGEAAVGLIFIATSACALTGLLLSRVLEQLAFQERLCLSLIDVARAAGGAPLAVIIDISSLAELFGYAIANLLVLGHTLRTIVPG